MHDGCGGHYYVCARRAVVAFCPFPGRRPALWTKAVLRVPFTLGCQGEAGSGWTFERRSCRNAGGPAVGGLLGTRPLWASWSGVS